MKTSSIRIITAAFAVSAIASGETLETSGELLMIVLTRDNGKVAQFFFDFALG